MVVWKWQRLGGGPAEAWPSFSDERLSRCSSQPMNRLHLLSALGLLSSLTVGCGGAADVNCPAGAKHETIPGSDFVGIPYAEEGNVCLTRTPFGGFPFLGKYEYDDFGTPSEPVVELWPEGQASYFQVHGVTKRTIEWGVAIDPEGHPIGQQTAFGAIVYLFFKYTGTGTPACTPGVICDPGDTRTISTDMGKWDAAQLSMYTDSETGLKRMAVYGERILECADASGACSLPVTPSFTWSK